MKDNCLLIGFCCTMMHKEPVKPVLDELVKLLVPREEYRMLVYHCFEDLYYETPANIGAESIYDMINYDMLDVMLLMQTCERQKERFGRIAEECK